jgi:hypothetical protein
MLPAPHNEEQIVGRIAVDEGAWIAATKTREGARLVEAEGLIAVSRH